MDWNLRIISKEIILSSCIWATVFQFAERNMKRAVVSGEDYRWQPRFLAINPGRFFYRYQQECCCFASDISHFLYQNRTQTITHRTVKPRSSMPKLDPKFSITCTDIKRLLSNYPEVELSGNRPYLISPLWRNTLQFPCLIRGNLNTYKKT